MSPAITNRIWDNDSFTPYFLLVQVSFSPLMSHFLASQQTKISLPWFFSGFLFQNGKLGKRFIYLFLLNILIANLCRGHINAFTESCCSVQLDWMHCQLCKKCCSNKPDTVSNIPILNSRSDGSANNLGIAEKGKGCRKDSFSISFKLGRRGWGRKEIKNQLPHS